MKALSHIVDLPLKHGMLDRIAIGLSGLCIVHCVGTAALLGLFSIGGGLLDPRIHEVGLGLAIAVGVVALVRGARIHGKLLPAMIGGLGLGVMAGAMTASHEGGGEAMLTILGVGIVAFGHYLNRRAVA